MHTILNTIFQLHWLSTNNRFSITSLFHSQLCTDLPWTGQSHGCTFVAGHVNCEMYGCGLHTVALHPLKSHHVTLKCFLQVSLAVITAPLFSLQISPTILFPFSFFTYTSLSLLFQSSIISNGSLLSVILSIIL